jgi:hypothetical protein
VCLSSDIHYVIHQSKVNTISLVSREDEQKDTAGSGSSLFGSSFGEGGGVNAPSSTRRSSNSKNQRGGRQFVERPPNPPAAKGGKVVIQPAVNPAKGTLCRSAFPNISSGRDFSFAFCSDGSSDENAWREVEIQRNQIEQMSAQIAKLREVLF